VIGERAGIEVTDAFSRLWNYARSRAMLLTDIAQASIDGTLEPVAWASPTSIDH
jgi:hypothetical protein